MKKIISKIFTVLFLTLSISSYAQNHGHSHDVSVIEDGEVTNINLEQVDGAFTQKELTLMAGEEYVFRITNNGVDHEVGFVIAPKGKVDAENHIKDSYVLKPVKDGAQSQSKVVVLEKGEYVYFCPLNPTPEYKLTVE